MDKGQHLRLVIIGGTAQSPTNNFVALSTNLSFHLSAQTEDSTTKDTTDTTGSWNSYMVTNRSGDITFSALVAVLNGDYEDNNGYYLEDIIDKVSDTPVDWKLVLGTVGSTKNRTISKTICSGKGKLTNLQVDAQNRQKATYSGTLNMYGPVTVGSD